MIKPVNKFILVEHISEEKKGSVFIPIANTLPYKKGIVKASSVNATQCKVGDQVAYLKRVVAEVDVDGKRHEFINEDSLIYIDEK